MGVINYVENFVKFYTEKKKKNIELLVLSMEAFLLPQREIFFNKMIC